MKKVVLIAIVLLAGIWVMSMRGHCELESEKTHKAALPIVEALAKYAEKNGEPHADDFKQIKQMPYEVKPCSERPDLMVCQVLKDGYFFHIDRDYYSIRLWRAYPSGFGLESTHRYTVCIYFIYDGILTKNYAKPACSLNNKCAGWFRQ